MLRRRVRKRIFANYHSNSVSYSMSKNLRAILFILLASVQILHLFNKVFDQDIEVTMSAADDSPARFHIEGKFLNGLRSNNRNLVLLNQYGGIVGLSDRASVLVLKNKDGGSVSFKKLISGEYLAEENFVRWSCNYELSTMAPASANAHVSWVGPDNGILMLKDLLPQMPGNKRFSARVTIVLPDGWRITTTERAAEKNIFEVADVENAEFVISKNAAGRILSDPDRSLTVLIFDNWNFADADSLSTVRDIHGYYSRI